MVDTVVDERSMTTKCFRGAELGATVVESHFTERCDACVNLPRDNFIAGQKKHKDKIQA